MMQLKGNAAIVTGGASGLGAETARYLAKGGAKVAVVDRNAELAQTVAKEIGGLAVACDVSDAAQGEAAVKAAREAHGPARILVNCAGIGAGRRIVGRDGPMPLDQFTRIINVNLVGSFNMMRLAATDMSTLPPLEDNERGIIISTASVAAFEGQIGQAAYSASKGGIVALTMPAAREFAQFGIRVNVIAPGIFLTPLAGGLTPEQKAALEGSIPFPKRMGHPHEYARLALHIIDNVHINGECIRIDGAVRLATR
jgi:NAD(P)-dependent dehydrogenase (short-subunit alcohol dehydrogenase family)